MTEKHIRSGPEIFDADARQAQVVGDPRIVPMQPHQFSDEARQLVEETFAHTPAIDTSDIPDIFGIMFKHPGLARVQMQLGLELGVRGHLPARERELATLRTGWLCRAPFEWGEHVPAARKAGLSDEEIERITQGSEAAGWNEHDRAVLRAVEELVDDHAIATATWAVLAKSWTDAQLLELPGLVGHYVMTAMVYNSVRFELLEGNIGLHRR